MFFDLDLSRFEILLSGILLVFCFLLILLWMILRQLRKKLLPPTYKVVDIFVVQDPQNHTDELNSLSREGWFCVSACSISKHAPEVRYVMAKPGRPTEPVPRRKSDAVDSKNSGTVS